MSNGYIMIDGDPAGTRQVVIHTYDHSLVNTSLKYIVACPPLVKQVSRNKCPASGGENFRMFFCFFFAI